MGFESFNNEEFDIKIDGVYYHARISTRTMIVFNPSSNTPDELELELMGVDDGTYDVIIPDEVTYKNKTFVIKEFKCNLGEGECKGVSYIRIGREICNFHIDARTFPDLKEIEVDEYNEDYSSYEGLLYDGFSLDWSGSGEKELIICPLSYDSDTINLGADWDIANTCIIPPHIRYISAGSSTFTIPDEVMARYIRDFKSDKKSHKNPDEKPSLIVVYKNIGFAFDAVRVYHADFKARQDINNVPLKYMRSQISIKVDEDGYLWNGGNDFEYDEYIKCILKEENIDDINAISDVKSFMQRSYQIGNDTYKDIYAANFVHHIISYATNYKHFTETGISILENVVRNGVVSSDEMRQIISDVVTSVAYEGLVSLYSTAKKINSESMLSIIEEEIDSVSQVMEYKENKFRYYIPKGYDGTYTRVETIIDIEVGNPVVIIPEKLVDDDVDEMIQLAISRDMDDITELHFPRNFVNFKVDADIYSKLARVHVDPKNTSYYTDKYELSLYRCNYGSGYGANHDEVHFLVNLMAQKNNRVVKINYDINRINEGVFDNNLNQEIEFIYTEEVPIPAYKIINDMKGSIPAKDHTKDYTKDLTKGFASDSYIYKRGYFITDGIYFQISGNEVIIEDTDSVKVRGAIFTRDIDRLVIDNETFDCNYCFNMGRGVIREIELKHPRALANNVIRDRNITGLFSKNLFIHNFEINNKHEELTRLNNFIMSKDMKTIFYVGQPGEESKVKEKYSNSNDSVSIPGPYLGSVDAFNIDIPEGVENLNCYLEHIKINRIIFPESFKKIDYAGKCFGWDTDEIICYKSSALSIVEKLTQSFGGMGLFRNMSTNISIINESVVEEVVVCDLTICKGLATYLKCNRPSSYVTAMEKWWNKQSGETYIESDSEFIGMAKIYQTFLAKHSIKDRDESYRAFFERCICCMLASLRIEDELTRTTTELYNDGLLSAGNIKRILEEDSIQENMVFAAHLIELINEESGENGEDDEFDDL